jgi:hypothetical protein
LSGLLWGEFARRNGSGAGDVLFSHAYICHI